jgi:SAM-dependent methyltransferase
MNIVDAYKRQFAWRDWSSVLDSLPTLEGSRVLDLGCGVGDVAALLSIRGARVVGIDINEEVLAAARDRGIPGAEFHSADLRSLPAPEQLAGAVDGLWCGFAIAYFTDPVPVVTSWARHLRPGGWVALVEIDDLFGHEPVSDRTRSLFAGYAEDALVAGRYDFRMGRRLRSLLEHCGFTVEQEGVLADLEFTFDGPARADVLDGWKSRMEHMKLLRVQFGSEFDEVRADFLLCLSNPAHRSSSRVRWCVGRR